MKNQFLILNATVQLGVAVALGWLMSMFFAFNTNQILIFKSRQKVTKAHLDFLMMSILQFAIAAAIGELPYNDILPFVIGTWGGPLLFMIGSVIIGVEKQIWYQALSTTSFISMTYGVYNMIRFIIASSNL